MKRRTLLSGLGSAVFGLTALPAWATNWKPNEIAKDTLQLSYLDDSMLSDLCETIIPETDSPGAKNLEVPQFVKTMISDVFEGNDQNKFKNSFVKIEDISKALYGQSYEKCSTAQKLHLLKGLPLSNDLDLKWFFNVLKSLTIQGYTSSEYYMTNIGKFEFAPARYYGCIPLNQ